MNARLSKSFGIGPKVEGGAANRSFGGPGGGGPPPGGGGPPGGGLGPGGLSRSGGPPRMDQVVARNIFNSVNLAQPVGVLQSPLFGKSNSLAGGFFSSPASNRSIDLQLTFNF
jgi:hypothetical protein